MKRYCVFLSFLILCCVCISGCNTRTIPRESTLGSYTVTDMQGTVVHMKKKPKRILTLSMETDEIMLGLVPPDRLVGVNALLDDPLDSTVVPQAKQISTKITDPPVEEILALKPDLVVIADWGNLEKADMLRDMGIPVVVCKGARTISDIRQNVMLLAEAIGEEDKGKSIVEQMNHTLDDIQKKVTRIPAEQQKSVVLISLMNNYGGIGSAFDDACKYAHVINGMARAGIHDGQPMSKEMLVKINPDYLFLPSYTNHGRYDPDVFIREYVQDPALQSLTAVREGHLVKPRESYIYNDSQDVVFGVQEIAYAVYGEPFAQPNGCHISAVDT